jgi:hypothetical protein
VHPACSSFTLMSAKKRSTWLIRLELAGGVQVEPRVLEQSGLRGRGCMGDEAVQDDVDVQLGGHGGVDGAQERQELLVLRRRLAGLITWPVAPQGPQTGRWLHGGCIQSFATQAHRRRAGRRPRHETHGSNDR